MDWYYYIAIAAIVSQLVFLYAMYRNYRYVLSKYSKTRGYMPPTVLLVPCKGIDSNFEKNIASFFSLDYENYRLWFVVADTADPAYAQLRRLKEQLAKTSKARDVRILVSGQTKSCSQKIHNLMYGYQNLKSDVEVLAFADSDICVRTDWLSHLVYPLHRPVCGAASGYRWYVPKTNNLATLAMTAINAKIAQLLGQTPFNQAWGGSMAIRVDTFRQVGLDKIWPKALSDDCTLTYAVKKAGKKVTFVPACLVATHESTTWRQLFEFARRQFIITRVGAAGTWWFGLLTSFFAVCGVWVGACLAIYAASIHAEHLALYISVPVIFFSAQLLRAILRQTMIRRLLADQRDKLKLAAAVDLLFFWLWGILLLVFILSSAFGRTIIWRGIRYKLLSPTETIIISNS